METPAVHARSVACVLTWLKDNMADVASILHKILLKSIYPWIFEQNKHKESKLQLNMWEHQTAVSEEKMDQLAEYYVIEIVMI